MLQSRERNDNVDPEALFLQRKRVSDAAGFSAEQPKRVNDAAPTGAFAGDGQCLVPAGVVGRCGEERPDEYGGSIRRHPRLPARATDLCMAAFGARRAGAEVRA
jgi:hypothetical protein